MGVGGNLPHGPSPLPSPTYRGAPLVGNDAAAAAATPMKKSLGGPATTRVYTKSDRASFLAAERDRERKHLHILDHILSSSASRAHPLKRFLQ